MYYCLVDDVFEKNQRDFKLFRIQILHACIDGRKTDVLRARYYKFTKHSAALGFKIKKNDIDFISQTIHST